MASSSPAGPPVSAAFDTSLVSPHPGDAVSFSDRSSGNPTSWLWSFGDGTSSTLKSPTHAYAAVGNYRVDMTASSATSSSVADALRAEAITVLGEWAKPAGRDHVTGLWRPLPERDAKVAATALQSQLPALLKSSATPVKLAATKVAAQLGIKGSSANAFEMLADTTQPSNVRVETLKSLATLKDPKLADAVKLGLADKDEAVRTEAAKIQAQLKPKDATAQIKATLEKGSLGEKQAAFATLAGLSGGAADEIFSQWLDKLLTRQIPTELQLDLLDAAAKRSAANVKEKLQKFETSRSAEDNLRAYRECLAGGNAEEGKKIFVERVEVSCIRCHKAGGEGGEGGEVGPDLTGLGSRKPREYILESIVFPNKEIAAGFESLIVTMKNGTAYAGLMKSETPAVLELNSPEDGLMKLNKADIKSRERGLSAMPEELRQVLTKQDLRNLVEFLSGMK